MRPNERPFRFGMSLRTSPLTRDDWKARAREAEAMGYDVLLAADHLLEIMPPLVGFAVAAEATNRLRFGTFVLNNDFRHPALLAREVAAIDNLTDGRFELERAPAPSRPKPAERRSLDDCRA